jgi:hypothetical protein
MSDETPDIEEIVENWAQARLEELAAEAGEVATLFYERAARERANRPRSQWGRLGVRVRSVRATRSAPGAFAIEWFTRRWVNKTAAGAQTFTSYIRRGTGDRYSRSALAAVAQPWELAIADALEDRFAEIRRLARAHGLSPACEARKCGGREGRARNPVTASPNVYAGWP